METKFLLDGFRREGSGDLSLDLSQVAPSGRMTFTLVVKGVAWHESGDQEPHHEEPANHELADDIFEEDFFLEGMLEMEREERERLGILGRWPFWELRELAIRYPERAEQVAQVGILLSGIMLGVLWHVVSPTLAWLWPNVISVSAFVGGVAAR